MLIFSYFNEFQIAVVFAIVIGGVLLLAAFIYVIYAAVVRSVSLY